jgi:trigger factor
MSCKVEDLGKNMVKLTIEATAEDFDKAIEKAYQKNKGKMNVQGFRKGKAPRAIIEKMYGVGVFYEDAANEIIPDAYEAAVKDTDIEIVSRPEVDIVQVEKGKPFIFTAEVAVKPVVELGQYKGVEVEKQAVEITEDEINAEVDKAREQNSRTINVEDRAVADKDTTVIDFEGFVDGVPFEGGKGEDFELLIGSHSFIDTFEEQLIGKSIGEETVVNVTFPAEYHAKELAGQPALFKVTVKSIKVKELPEADDDFAQDVSDFNSIAEYKEDIKKNLTEKKAKAAKSAKEDAVVDKIIENATMEIPSQMVDSQKRQMAEDFTQRLQTQGLSLEQYFQFTGMNPNKFMENLEPQALKRIQSRLVLETIVKAENIKIAEEDIEKEFEEMAKTYQMELDKLKELIGEKEKEQIVMDMAVQKAIDLVTDSAKEV